MSDRDQSGGNGLTIGAPIALGGTPVYVEQGKAFRPGDGSHGIPGAQRELVHDAQRGRMQQIPAGLPAGQVTGIFDSLQTPGGHPTLMISMIERGSYASFPWRCRAIWNIGSAGLFQADFDVGAIGGGVHQGVVWSLPADRVQLAIINPAPIAGGATPATVAVAAAWGAQPYPFRRPLTLRIVGGALVMGNSQVHPVPAFARGVRVSADQGVAAGWTQATIGLEFRDQALGIIGGDTMQATQSMGSLVLPAAVPLGAVDVRITAMSANVARYMLEWELSL